MAYKIICKGLFFIYIFLAPCVAFGEYNGALFTLFFGHQPSARAEALGKGSVAMEGNAFASFYNPAGIATIKGFSFGNSYAGQYYFNNDTKSNFFGGSFPLREYGVIGLSRYQLDWGEITRYDDTAQERGSFNPKDSMFSLTFASEPGKNLFIGVNADLIQCKIVDELHDNVYLGDIGVLKIFEPHSNNKVKQKIGIGASVFNFTNSEIFGNDLPIIFRLGSSYKLTLSGESSAMNLKPIELLLHIEHQDLLNSKYYGGFKAGGEVSLWEIIAFRYGHYKEKKYGHPMEDTTYGFGIQLPINKISKSKIPLDIKFDMVRLDQPSYIADWDDSDDFSVYNLSINWQY